MVLGRVLRLLKERILDGDILKVAKVVLQVRILLGSLLRVAIFILDRRLGHLLIVIIENVERLLFLFDLFVFPLAFDGAARGGGLGDATAS
jgi:hypothetical protein